MLRIAGLLSTLALVLAMVSSVDAAKAPPPAAFTDAAQAGPDFAVQGEYVGTLPHDGKEIKYGGQVIALGNGKFHGVGYVGGLPGDGWDKSARIEADGQTTDAGVVFTLKDGATGAIKDGLFTVKDAAGKTLGTLSKVSRKSPTLVAKAPAGAVVLFDGTTADHFIGGRMTKDGLLMEGATSKEKFQSYTAHIEFLIPFMPTARGQGRGNSGCYAQGRYEVQVLDSFGLPPKNNECGGIYGIESPETMMSFPPLSWQTYDVDFTAAQYKDGKKVQDALITVRHNGVQIHKDCKLTHGTTAAPVREGPEPGPLYLQNHGNPVRFRNVWVLEKK